MKKLLSFISYHNAVPATLIVLALGGSAAFAATVTGVLPLPAVATPPTATQPQPVAVDAFALLAANPDTFDFRPTVTGVVETDSTYTVSYSISTLAPQGSAWGPYEKTGEFSVAKDVLPEDGLQGYVVRKLEDLESGERAYLARAQAAEKALVEARVAQPANAFAALVGLALDQIFVPVIEKLAPATAPQSASTVQPATDNVATSENAAHVTATTTAEQIATDEQSTSHATSAAATSTDSVSEPQTETTATTTEAVNSDVSAVATEPDNSAASSTEQTTGPASEQATSTTAM